MLRIRLIVVTQYYKCLASRHSVIDTSAAISNINLYFSLDALISNQRFNSFLNSIACLLFGDIFLSITKRLSIISLMYYHYHHLMVQC